MRRPAVSRRGFAVGVAAVIAAVLFVQSTPPAQRGQFENAALSVAVGTWSQDGGTLTLGGTRYCDSFDPAQSFDAWCSVIFRLYSRNLMAFQGKPGEASLIAEPDLAREQPTVSSDKTKWTFRIRKDAKWSDGTAITAQDVKYTMERLFDPKIIGSVSSTYLCLLATCVKGIPQYAGPRIKQKTKLTSVIIRDSRTVTFKLKTPFVDFDRVLALPQFSIVHRKHELMLQRIKKSYGDNPSSSGPYALTRNATTKSIQFVRNLNWSQSSDPIRNPHLDVIKWRNYRNDILLDRAVINGAVDIRLGDGLGAEGLRLLESSPKLNQRTDTPYSGFVNYFAINQDNVPLNRLDCRKAIFYGIDKATLQNIRGGSRVSAIATSMLPPLVAGYDPTSNLYSSGRDDSGNLSAAREALKKCGYPDGFEFTIAYLNTGIGPATVRSLQTSLARIGLVVVPKKFNTYAKFAAVVQSPEKLATAGISVVISGNGSVIQSAYDYWAPIADSRLITAFGNDNLAQISDPSINQDIDALTTHPENRVATSAKINAQVMETAQYLPYAFDQHVLFRGSHLANVYVQQGLSGYYDIVNIALAK